MNRTSIVLFLLYFFLVGCSERNDLIASTSNIYKNPSREFFSTKDLLHVEDSNSNLTLQYAAGGNVYGLYVALLSAGLTCGSNDVYAGSDAGGVVFKVVPFSAGQSKSIGANFLYNMINGALFFGKTSGYDSLTLKPGENGPIWCFHMGVLSANTCQSCGTTGIDLVTTPVDLKITCSDSTETCVYTSTGPTAQTF